MAIRSDHRLQLAALGLGLALLAGCGGDYYQVTDPGSGRVYFTRDIDRDEGQVRFKDAVSGDKVNLGSAEVKEITREQYRSATGR